MALTRVTSGGIAPGIVIKFDSNNTPTNPAISFDNSNDTGTGIYQSGDNEIAFATAGLDRLKIQADGQVVTGNGTILGGTNPDFDNAINVIMYVNQSDKNATDAESNEGGNLNKPFKTIERALLEASKKSYVAAADDKFEAYTIMVMPGDYEIDNRPGYDVTSNPIGTGDSFETNLHRFNPRNGGVIVPRGTSVVGYDLRKTVIRPKFVPTPSLDGGAIDGDSYEVSGVKYDAANIIEKCRGYIQEQAFLHIKNTYPNETDIDATCKRDIGYFIDGVIKDLRAGGNSHSFIVGEFYTNGTSNEFLNDSTEVAATVAAFNKARDIMKASLDYDVQSQWNNNGNGTTTHGDTSIGSYYNEITTGKTVWRPDINNNVDYTGNETASNECAEARDAVTNLTTVVTTIVQNPSNYNDLVKKTVPVAHQTAIFKVTGGCYFWQMTFKDAKGTPYNKVTFNGSGVPTFTTAANAQYSHHRVVSFTYADQRTTDGELERYYKRIDSWAGTGTRIARDEEYEIVGNASLKSTIDTVNSCSPYIFNCSLRSIFGLCGMHTDGSKVKENSFKSMVVAQFTGISLQKDPNAYWQPRNKTGKVYTSGSPETGIGNTVTNNAAAGESATNRGPIYADPDAEYRHDWRHFHIKASNGAFIQVVSVFAVGYADQFLAVNGGDMSITNSNSNFGQISLRAAGHKFKADKPSAYGKITAIIPPAGIDKESQYTELYPIAADTTWEANLGATADKTEPSWANSKTKFSTSGNTLFKLYFEIPGVTKEDEIPELVVESKDLNGGAVKVKRFLTYGSSNNFNLFRSYYETSGVLPANSCKIVNQVDSDTGGLSTYEAVVSIATPTDDGETKNHERVGYKWDRTRQKVYVELDSSKAETRTYVADFIFSDIIETTFVTETVTNDDGSTSVVSSTRDVNVLEYWDGFPGSTTVAKLIDSRASSPNDLLWRVKYIIPKDYRDSDDQPLTPKPPEKRFIIKGTNPGNDADGNPYTNYRFTIWDVQEVQTWERDTRDGEYYLTILRADIDKYVDGPDGSGYENTPYVITRDRGNDTDDENIISDRLSELAFDDRNYRVSSNVNYLYPSTNEEGNIDNPRVIWNPPQTDSRVIIEEMPGNGNFGFRPKDVSVPNKKYYNSSDAANTPFHEVPALTSLTAEAVHRLVHALDLCYIQSNKGTTTNVKVAPVASWDDRSGKSTFNDVSTTFRIYGTVGNAYRYGTGSSVINDQIESDANTYGLSLSEEERKIPVCESTSSTISGSHDENSNLSSSPYAIAPVVPLLRPSILRASSHTWEYIGIGPGNYSTGFPNLQTRVLKAYEQFIAQGYENAGGFVASSGTNSAGDFYIGNQVIQAGGQSTTTLNVPKVRKSSESNAVDVNDIENRIANNVINVIPSANKSSAQQNLLKGLSNFFTTARLTVTDRANIQTLYVTDRMFIANNSILNGEKFPEGGPEGYGFTKGARPEKTGYIATDTNDRLYVSPKFLDAWRIKKKILSASNINLDNNRIYIEPLSRTFAGFKQNDSSVSPFTGSQSTVLETPVTFTGIINSAGSITTVTLTGLSAGKSLTSVIYEGMRVAQVGNVTDYIREEAIVTDVTGSSITLQYVNSATTSTFAASSTAVSFYAVDQLKLIDTSGMPPFGRIDIEMTLDFITTKDYILVGTEKRYLNPTINISLQYDDVDYTNSTVSVSSSQNFAPYQDYVNSVLPKSTDSYLHTVIRNYPSVIPSIEDTEELSDSNKYLFGSLGSGVSVSANAVSEEGTANTASNRITLNSALWTKLPSRGAVTLREVDGGVTRYSTFVYFKDLDFSNKISLLRKVTTQSNNDVISGTPHSYTGSGVTVFFSGCKTYASYADKWTVESAFIPDVEEISEDVDIESATLYELPEKPVPFTGKIDESYTDSIVPNPVTSKALGANLQTKRTVKTFQPFENLKQVADFAQNQGFIATDTVEVLMKPGYYRLYSDSDTEYTRNIVFPCKLTINGSGSKKTNEQYSKELANAPAGRIGGYSLKTVKSGDSVSFFRSPQFRNNWGGRTDLLYVNNIGDRIESTGGIDIQNVHFLGLNEAITRNEILDNAYSRDSATIAARRKVRKAWYVKQSKGFVSEKGIEGGLSFQTKYSVQTTPSNGGSFDYLINTSEFTDSTRAVKNPDVNNTTFKSKNARYIKFTFDRSDFTNETRFNWLIEYVIPGTTLYYFANQSGKNWTSSTKKTRVLDVKKVTTTTGGVTTVDSFEVYAALYDPSTSFTSKDADMDLTDIGMVDAGLSEANSTSLSNGIQCLFTNRDGDEFVTLTYNWCKEKRKELLPKSFTTSGEGFDDTIYDTPRIFGIVAGYRTDTLNLVIDTHPSREIGGVKTFSRTGVANASATTTSFTIDDTKYTTTGSGTGAVFKVDLSGTQYSITVQDDGENFAIDDEITILGGQLGGTNTTNDITMTIGDVNPAKKQYPASNLFNFYPSAVVHLTDNSGNDLNEEYSYTLPVFPNGYRRLYGRQSTRYYLLEVKASEVGALNDNNGHNGTVAGQFNGFGYSDIDRDETTNITVGDVTFQQKDRKRTSFTSDAQFEAIAKYNLSQAGTGYRESGSGINTVGRKITMNYARTYKVSRKKFPTSAPPSVGNLGATLIKVTGIPGSTNKVTLRNVTIGAMSDANDRSNTYGGGYHGGIISIENGQVDLRGVRFRGNLSLDWSGLLTDGGSRLSAENRFTYGHSVDLLETSGIIQVSRFGDSSYRELNVSKDDILYKNYSMFKDDNNLYIEPNKLPSGEVVDYDQRTFPITTINAIPKYNQSGGWNTSVEINERFLSDKIVTTSSTSGTASGLNLRFNNNAQFIITGKTTAEGGNTDGTLDLEPKTVTFKLPYTSTGEKSYADEVAKNIIPNFTTIIRNGNPDSVLATVTGFEFYQKGSTTKTAYFSIKYSGNIQYESQNDMTDTSIDFSGFELQFLTKYIPSQRFNYVSSLTTRYVKRSNADGTNYSKYELGFDEAQSISIFANSKDFAIEKLNSGSNNISRNSSGSANILHFRKLGTTLDTENDVQVVLETNASGNVTGCDIVSIGLNNAKDDVLYYPMPSNGAVDESTFNGYKITMLETTQTRTSATDTDYDMFEPGEVVNNVENSSFLVNNFVETNLTGIKGELQKVKSIITPGSYIEYGGQYYKIAYSTPGRPYLGIHQYANPNNPDDVRTSLVIRLEETTYAVTYNKVRNGESITRFDLFEDDNILRYWPDSGRCEIGELELCDFTKKYVDANNGYRITLTRSNTKFWPSYIHDWDGLEIADEFTAGDSPSEPTLAVPGISTGSIISTSIRLADPVDTTSSTFKRVAGIGFKNISSSYMTKDGVLTTQRAYIDIASDDTQIDFDAEKFEVGQIVSLPWRNLGLGSNNRGYDTGTEYTDKYSYTPKNIMVTVTAPKGEAGLAGSTNRVGDARISAYVESDLPCYTDIVDVTDRTDGVARLTNNLNNLHHIVNSANSWTGDRTGHNIYDTIDPLTLCRSIKSFSTILGKPHSDNNSATCTLVAGETRKFTVTQSGVGSKIGIGLFPGIVVVNSSYFEEDTQISGVSRSGSTAGSYTYTITLNKEPENALPATFTATFTNRRYTEFELFNPLLQNISAGDTFQIVPQFNTEGHPWRRHNEVFTSRISDIEPLTASEAGTSYGIVRLHLSDPFESGDTGSNTYNTDRYSSEDPKFLTSVDSRYFGFISINHGGWSFPRSGGSYQPSNMVRLSTDPSVLYLPNFSGRIQAGDTVKYTYEANTLLQEIARDSFRDSNHNRFLLRNSSVDEGDTFVGIDQTVTLDQYGVEDRFRTDGDYTVYHVRYENKSGDITDNYSFGNTSANSFWNGSSFSTNQPTTKYEFDGTTHYVDIGGGTTLGAGASYSTITGDATAIETALNDDYNNNTMGVWDGTTQQSSDPWLKSLVRTNGGGVDAQISFTVTNNKIDASTLTIDAAGTGYEVDDWIIISGAIFNFDNPKYAKDVYLYISDVDSNGGIKSFQPYIKLTNEGNSTEILIVRYDSTSNKFKIMKESSGTLVDVTTSDVTPIGTVGTDGFDGTLPDSSIFVDTITGSWVYLKAQIPNAEGELIDWRFDYIGGFTAGMKLVFAKPKPSLKLVSGTVVSVVSPGSDGYSEVKIDSPDNIIYSTYSNPSDWLSISDILISHSSDLFARDGAVCLRFMHSEFGGTMEFESFRVWNDWYRNGSQNKGFGVYGSHGWVGNWGRTVDGARPIGMTSTGSLTVNWGRQRGNSIWKTAQPVRPIWTHRGTTGDVLYNGAAFTPAQRYFYTNGTNSFYTTSLVNYLQEDNQVFDNIGYGNVIQHISNTSDDIKMTLSTNKKWLREDWWSGRYYEGGFGPLSYQPYQWSSTFDSVSSSRLVLKNKVSYQLQDLKFRANDTYGNINWGSGRKARLTEYMVADYIQHYSVGPVKSDVSGLSIFNNAGIKVRRETTSERGTTDRWYNQLLINKTDAGAGNTVTGNVRTGKKISSGTVTAGRTYIIATSTDANYVVGQLWIPSNTTLPAGVTVYEYRTKIARGDSIYLSPNGGTTMYYVGQVRYVGGGSGENDVNYIHLTQNLPDSIGGNTNDGTNDFDLFYVRTQGIKQADFSGTTTKVAYSQRGGDTPNPLSGENVLSAEMPGALNYNMSIIIDKRNYNTSPVLNTVGDVKPVGNFWWYWGAVAANRSIRSTAGDLSGLNWSQMNINITRFNPKVHLESAVTVTSSPSSTAVNNVYI